MTSDPKRPSSEYTPLGSATPVRQRSSWLFPLAIVGAVAVIGGAILLYYLGPRPADIMGTAPRPTASAEPIAVSVGSLNLVIPANYLRLPAARSGGPQDELVIDGLLPDLRGFGAGDASAFEDTGPDSRVVHILVRKRSNVVDERGRFDQMVRNGTVSGEAASGPDGLTRHAFSPDSDYPGEEVFVADVDGHFVSIRCNEPEDPEAVCWRSFNLAPGVHASYQYKRRWLDDWRAIDETVVNLLTSFRGGS